MTFSVARRRTFLSLLCAISGALGPRSAGATTMARDVFRDEVLAIGRQRYPVPPMQPNGFSGIIWGDKTLYLDNIYAMAATLPPAEREIAILDWLAKFSPEADAKAQAIKALTDEWENAKPLLRPKFYPRSLVAQATQLVWRDFSPNLVAGYTIDLGDKDLYVATSKFAKWRVPMTTVDATAITNLESLSARIPLEAETPDGATGRFLKISTGDGYDAVRVLLPAFRARLMSEAGPSIFCGIPGRDLLAVWSRDFSMRAQAGQTVQDYASRMPHALTDEIFVVDDTGLRLATAVDMAP